MVPSRAQQICCERSLLVILTRAAVAIADAEIINITSPVKGLPFGGSLHAHWQLLETVEGPF